MKIVKFDSTSDDYDYDNATIIMIVILLIPSSSLQKFTCPRPQIPAYSTNKWDLLYISIWEDMKQTFNFRSVEKCNYRLRFVCLTVYQPE